MFVCYLAKNLSQCNAKTIDTGLGGSVRSRVKSIHPATLVGILVQSIKVNSDALVNENHVDGIFCNYSKFNSVAQRNSMGT